MPNEQKIDLLFDVTLMEKQQDAVMKLIADYNKAVNKASNIQVKIDGSKGSLELGRNIKEMSKAQEEIIKKNALYASTIQIVTDTLKKEGIEHDNLAKKKKDQIIVDKLLIQNDQEKIKLRKLQSAQAIQQQKELDRKADREKKLLDEQRKQIENSTKLTRQEKLEAEAILNKAGSYNQISALMRLYQIQLKDLSEGERNSEFGQALTTRINGLNDQLKTIDATMGNHQRKVGDYANAFVSAAKIIKDELAKTEKAIAEGNVSPAEFDQLKKKRDALQGAVTKVSGNFSSLTSASGTFNTVAKELGATIGTDTSLFHAFSTEVNAANKTIRNAEDAFDDMGKSGEGAFDGLGKNIKNTILGFVGFYAVFAGVKQFFTDSIREADQAEQSATQLANALDNAGRSDLFDKLSASADNLADKFNRLDNDDIKGVFTKLVTYGKLTENQMNDLTEVIINYAAKTKTALPEATDLFLKALEGSDKGLKVMGVSMKDASNVTERFGILMDDVGKKVAGSEAAFERTAKGGYEKFKQKLNNIKESFGLMLFDMLSTKKTSDQLFDEAKINAEKYENSLNPLLKRYDELKSKTTLNKDEQTELKGVIEKIVDIVPDAATEFDKYGQALDINKEKVSSFIKIQKGILAEKEFKAVEGLVTKVKNLTTQIEGTSSVLSRGFTTKTVGKADTEVRTDLTEEDKKRLRANIIGFKEEAVNVADLLKQKYGKELPDSIGKTIEQFRELLTGVKKVEVSVDGGNTVVGDGDPNKDTDKENKDKENAEKQKKLIEESLKRAAEFSRKRRDELNKFNADELKAQQDKYKEIITDEKKSFEERLEAAQSYYDYTLSLNELDKKNKLRVIKEEADLALKSAVTSDERSEIIKLQKQKEQNIIAESNRVIVDAAKVFQKDVADVTKQANEKELEALKEHRKKVVEMNEQRKQVANDLVDIDRDKEAATVLAEYSIKISRSTGEERVRLEKELQVKLEEIDEKAHLKKLMLAEKELRYQLVVATAFGVNTSSIEAAITANLREQVETRNNIRKGEKENAEEINTELLESIIAIEQRAADIIGGFMDAANTKKKNKIQDEIDGVDKKAAKDIEAVNKLAITEEQKAAKIDVINQVAARKKQQLEFKQRQLDIERAKFEKMNSILQLIGATAVTVMKDGGPLSPKGIIDLAFGIAQLGVIIATPIPKFEKGLFHDYEGYGIINDGKKLEAVVRADGSIELPTQRNKVEHFKRGDRVIPDAKLVTDALYNASIGDMIVGYDNKNNDSEEIRNMTDELKQELREVNDTIKEKPIGFINITQQGFEWGFTTAAGRTTYLNSHINF